MMMKKLSLDVNLADYYTQIRIKRMGHYIQIKDKRKYI